MEPQRNREKAILKKLTLALFCLFTSLARGEVLSLPEDCVAKEVTPCLIRALDADVLQGKAGRFQLELGTGAIVKLTSFTPALRIDLLQGELIVRGNGKKPLAFKINEVPFSSKAVLVQIREREIKAFDTKTFILSQYQQSNHSEQETVITRAEFLSKLDMIKFVSNFYPEKNKLLAFLKAIEPAWQKEFATQTAHQTKALERSDASVEADEAETQRKKRQQEADLKNMRNLFFYRTFYR